MEYFCSFWALNGAPTYAVSGLLCDMLTDRSENKVIELLTEWIDFQLSFKIVEAAL